MDDALIEGIRELLAVDPSLGYRSLHTRLKADARFKDISLKKVQVALKHARDTQDALATNGAGSVEEDASSKPCKSAGLGRKHVEKLAGALFAVQLPCAKEKDAILKELLAIDHNFEDSLIPILRRLGRADARGIPYLQVVCPPDGKEGWHDDMFQLEYARRFIKDKLPYEGRLPKLFEPVSSMDAFFNEMGRRSGIHAGSTRDEADAVLQKALRNLPKTPTSFPAGDLAELETEALIDFILSTYEAGAERTEVKKQLDILNAGLSAQAFKRELVKFATVARKDMLSRMKVLDSLQQKHDSGGQKSDWDTAAGIPLDGNSVPASVNPPCLEIWSGALEPAFQAQFSLKEGFEFQHMDKKEPMDPNLELRTILLALATLTDKGKRKALFVNSNDNSTGIILHVVEARSVEERPLLEVEWLFSTWESVRSEPHVKAMGAFCSECEGSSISVQRSTVHVCAQLLKLNYDKLDSGYTSMRERSVKKPIQISVLSPIEKKSRSTKTCGYCGACPVKAQHCKNCGETYCNIECQRAHWAVHRQACKKMKNAPSDCAEINLTILTPMAAMFAQVGAQQGYSSVNINVNESRVRGRQNFETVERSYQVPVQLRGQTVVVKMQVAMNAPLTGSARIYDKSREFDCFADPSNCSRFEELARTVVSKGEAGGLKAYFRAWLPQTSDGVVKIAFTDGPLPSERW